MTIEATTQSSEPHPKKGSSGLLVGLAVGAALIGMVALGGTAQKAEAAFTE